METIKKKYMVQNINIFPDVLRNCEENSLAY